MNSVTRVIRNSIYNPDCLSLLDEEDRGILFSAVHHAFGPIPERPYTVTYEISEDGIEVRVEDGQPSLIIGKHGLALLAVCFLPPEWIGKRVTRRVHSE